MSDEPVFSRRLLIGWVAGAVAVFAVSLYLMGAGELTGPESVGASTFSRSAIGHAGIAEVLQRLDIHVVKSQYDSLEKLTPGSVLVIAEPRPARQSEEAIRTLLKANTILLVLPKWTGRASEQHDGWLREVDERFLGDATWALNLVAPRAEVVRERGDAGATIIWSTNALGLVPNLALPVQLVRGPGLRPIIGSDKGMLIGEISERDRRIWVLSDPDVISNHGLARAGNAALAVAVFKRLLNPPPPSQAGQTKGKAPPPKGKDTPTPPAGGGTIVFDETVHGYIAKPVSPFMLLFRFPFVIATVQGLIAVALLLWATLARFGVAQSAPPALRAGREGLLQNMAKMIEFTGHQQVMIVRYTRETVRDVARQLHAPRGLSGEALMAWLQRVGAARGTDVDCGAVARRAAELGEGRRRDLAPLIRLARDIHRWKGEVLDGRSRHPRDR
jgi:uncharacterized protein DUF4350